MSFNVRREGKTIFIALPPEAWRPTGGCSCDECKAGAAQAWDTLAVRAKPTPGENDFAYTCHYPEVSQRRPYCVEQLPNEGGPQ